LSSYRNYIIYHDIPTITKSLNYLQFWLYYTLCIPKGDGMLDIWDCSSPLRPSVKINAHQAEILSCSWNQFYPFVLATGGAEGLIRIWDIRKLLTPIFQLEVGVDTRFYKRFFYDRKRHEFVTIRIDFWRSIRFNLFFFLIYLITGLPRCSETSPVFASPLVHAGFGIIWLHDKVYIYTKITYFIFFKDKY